jgi:adenylate cyclase
MAGAGLWGGFLTGERVVRRLAAILSADVVGYSRLMGRDERGTLARLLEHRKQRFEPSRARHRGRLVKLTGDGALVEFPSAVDALGAAIEFQQLMSEANLDQPADTAIVFRVGLHIGDLIVDGDDLYGDGVNVAARLEAEAPPGGIVISGDMHNAVVGRLEAAFEDLGNLSLKNIDRPVQAFRVKWQPIDWMVSAPGPAIDMAALPFDAPPALDDKPSIAVLPFQNMSGDPEQEYFADGLAEDIITELSRFREFAVIARNSTFFYKGKPIDVAQVARELRVRYVLEGSVRKAGGRVRVTAQLIDAATNDHLWAERYDREYAEIFDLQEEITRTVVASIAPRIDLAELHRARRDTTDNRARLLAWRALGYLADALKNGEAALMPRAIEACAEAIRADPASLAAHNTLVAAHWYCHLFRWGDQPERALDRAWAAVERMAAIDSQDERTLTMRGLVRVNRGEFDGGLADLRRAYEINPNYASAIVMLAFAEATAGLAQEAKAHAQLALRLSPRDANIGVAHLALAMAHFTLRDYDQAVRWCESAIQVDHRAPIRRALMIACSARAGDMARARAEIAVLGGFAPGFVGSVFRGENPVFARREDMQHLLDGLRLAGLSG